MRKVLVAAIVGYLGLALWGHRKERSGALVCGCAGDCWCKEPSRSLFRWVFPFGHHVVDREGS